MAKPTASPPRGPSYYVPWLFDERLFTQHGHLVPGDDRDRLTIVVRGGVRLDYKRGLSDWRPHLRVTATDLCDREVLVLSCTPDEKAMEFWQGAASHLYTQQDKQREASLKEVQRIVTAALGGHPEPAL